MQGRGRWRKLVWRQPWRRAAIRSEKSPQRGFLQRVPLPKFGTDEGGGFGPHYKGLRDDLDVPTFIRKQMD